MKTIKNLLVLSVLGGIAALSIAQQSPTRMVDPGQNFTVSDSPETTVFNLQKPSTNRHINAIGRTSQPQVTEQRSPSPPAPVARNRDFDNCSPGRVTDYVDKYLVRLDKSAPASVSLNAPYDYSYNVIAKDKIKRVVVWEQIPEGAVYVSSSPQARVEGRDVIWTLYNLSKGDRVPLSLTVRPTEVTDLSSCAAITAYPEACVTTVVGVPELSIVKTTPNPQVRLGSSVPWDITVTNTGTFCAYDVVVTDTIPFGVSHQNGSREFISEIGTLAPGESRDVRINTTAVEVGEHCNVAMVSASNAASVSDEACVIVLDAGLEVTKEGTPMQFIGKTAVYRIAATNTGQIPLDDVIVTDTVPRQNRLLEAPGARVDGNVATWGTSLAPGETKIFELSVLGLQGGTYCNEVRAASAAYGLRSSDDACTEWRGYPALLLEVIDTEDPLLVGEQTTYVIQVTNQGTDIDTNVSIDAALPANLRLVSATGSTRGSASANRVQFDAYPVLNPKEIIEYRVVAEAIAEGDSRFRVQMNSDLLRTPVPEEEATQVY
jgi:uncharacterized repeat protein (TIGR01451 family)